MQLTTLSPAQMIILESFASVQDEQETNALIDLLRNFYATRLQAEMQKLWDNGTLDQAAIDKQRCEHFRMPYRQ